MRQNPKFYFTFKYNRIAMGMLTYYIEVRKKTADNIGKLICTISESTPDDPEMLIFCEYHGIVPTAIFYSQAEVMSEIQNIILGATKKTV
jgi:hypothetical protein